MDCVDVGEEVLSQTCEDFQVEREKAVTEALRVANGRHEQQMKKTVEQLRLEAEIEKQDALVVLQQRLEEEAAIVAIQRQKEEEERIVRLKKEWERETRSKLEAQRLELEKAKELAVEDALKRLEAKLRKEFVLTKELEIAAVLANAREKFKVRERETAKRVRRECEASAAVQREQEERLHTQQINELEEQLSAAEEKYNKETEYRQTVEQDFNDLQDDYRRFLDNTQGRFHSDYMMHLRFYGSRLPQDVSDVIETKNLPPRPKLRSSAPPTRKAPPKLLPHRRNVTNL